MSYERFYAVTLWCGFHELPRTLKRQFKAIERVASFSIYADKFEKEKIRPEPINK